MKKLTYLLAAAAVFAACNSGNQGYTVTGTIEGATDGDTVFLQTVEGRQLVKLDSAVITNGTFSKTEKSISNSTERAAPPPVPPTTTSTRLSEPSSTNWTARWKTSTLP